jgi:hypothetical protein
VARMSREDFAEMRRSNNRAGHNLKTKAQEQSEIDRHKAEFFAKGGRIQGIPLGVSGDKTVIKLSQRAAGNWKGVAACAGIFISNALIVLCLGVAA